MLLYHRATILPVRESEREGMDPNPLNCRLLRNMDLYNLVPGNKISLSLEQPPFQGVCFAWAYTRAKQWSTDNVDPVLGLHPVAHSHAKIHVYIFFFKILAALNYIFFKFKNMGAPDCTHSIVALPFLPLEKYCGKVFFDRITQTVGGFTSQIALD